MANCPHCAEHLGLLHALRVRRAPRCPACRLPLETDRDGRIQTYARRHAAQILAAPRGARVWIMFGAGAATTLLSAIPTLGVLPALLVTPVQVALLARSVQRYREHFGLLHGLTADFFASLLFLLLLGVQTASNLLLQALSPLVNLPVFALVWLASERYYRWHFLRVASDRGPSPVELGVIGLFAATVTLPPAALFVAFLVSYLSP